MAMVNMKDLLQHAYQSRYAVGAFEIVSLDFLQAVIEAAERARSPVILNIVDAHSEMFNVELLTAAAIYSANTTEVPVCVQLDHCKNAESVKKGIRLGCNGFMYDGSHESFPDNVQYSKEFAELAHSCGVAIEGEIGIVAGMQQIDSPEENISNELTSVSEAKAYVERTNVDFLAIAVGNEHGKTDAKVKLDFNRLARINDGVQKPLVIHGGSGLSDDQYHKLIDHGVAKINYFTELAEKACNQVKSNLGQKDCDYQRIFEQVRLRVSEETQRCMQIWGSAGRAAEVLLQCRPWRNVQHVVAFSSNDSDESSRVNLLTGLQQQLQDVPGVLGVQLGQSIGLDEEAHYFWLIKFTSEKALNSYLPKTKQTVFDNPKGKLNYRKSGNGDYLLHEGSNAFLK